MAHHKHQKSHGGGGVNLGLIITPMLDMSFQILSFFIMTYHPSALEGQIAGSLAPPEVTATKGKENNVVDLIPPSVPEDMLLPEIQEAMTIIIKTGGASPGQPDKLLLKRKTEPAPDQLADNTVAWEKALQMLSGRLKQFKKDSGGDNMKIEADGDLRQEYVIDVYDVCKLAGFNKIHFVPPPLQRQAEK